jgi:uncharacterized damage-inducible protein DinB
MSPTPPPEPYTTLLDEALDAWEDTRKGVLEESRLARGETWDFRPVRGARSFGEIVRHIVESGLLMTGELTRPDGDFTRQAHGEHVREHAGHLEADADRERLLELLSLTFAEGAAALRAAGELHMLQYVRRFDGQRGTRLAWMHHGIAHESYHRGQLASYLRRAGETPALTRRIQAGGD